MANKECFGSFKTILDSFQEPCLNHHKFNILDSVWCISNQNKCQLLNFKFLYLLCPSRSIVAIYEQILLSVKNTQKHGNFHNISDSPLKLTPGMTTISTHIVSKLQPCIPSINKVIAKSVLGSFFHDISFQDHCTSVWVKINHMVYLVRNSQSLCICLGHIWHSFQDPCPNSASKRLFSNSFQDPCI